MRNPRLREIPLIFESPRYFRNVRLYGVGLRIVQLEDERAIAEIDIVKRAVSLSDEQWARERTEVWDEYQGQRRSLENRIYKLLKKEGGAMWTSFKKGRELDVSRTRGAERYKRKRAESAGEVIRSPKRKTASDKMLGAVVEMDGGRLLRSGRRYQGDPAGHRAEGRMRDST